MEPLFSLFSDLELMSRIKGGLLLLVLILISVNVNASVRIGSGPATDGVAAMQPNPIPNPGADLWRVIRKGQKGVVANPGRNSAQLVVAIPRGDCQQVGSCTEQAVGFTLPIHALVPEIKEPEGVDGTMVTIGFVSLLFGGLLFAGVLFAVRLTSAETTDVTTRSVGKNEEA